MTTTKLIFLGGGNMAEAIFSSLINNQNFEIEVVQRNDIKAIKLKEKYPNIKISKSLDYEPNQNDIVILAVKPQQAKESCLAIKEKLTKCILLSVMAGISSDALSQWLNNDNIIRTMPNTPTSIKLGVTAIFYSTTINESIQVVINNIFASIGLVYLAKDESEINKILPVSSSAVAFIYYFMEGFINSAVREFGFTKENATEIVKQTMIGSIGLLNASPDVSIEEQRAKVTSKKGTTEQGLITFQNLDLHGIINKAMENCYNRAIEISQEFK